MRRLLSLGVLVAALTSQACAGFLFSTPKPLKQRVTQPKREDARLAVAWAGHATMLIQMDDKLILTDPFLTDSVGILSVRLQEAGLDPASLPPLDAVVVSHMHFDHLSLGSLDLIEDKTRRLYVPRGGTIYLPNYDFPVRELATWEADEASGLRITSVPVKHVGFRYGVDGAWMTESFTGYMLEYHGLTVYFAGDTAYDRQRFRATAARFSNIDLALLPIAPIHPRGFMERTHVDPAEALRAFRDLGAHTMVPMHYDTLVNGFDSRGEPLASLKREMAAQAVGAERVRILPIGGQSVLLARAPALTE